MKLVLLLHLLFLPVANAAVEASFTNNVPTEFKLMLETILQNYQEKEKFEERKEFYQKLNKDLQSLGKASSYAIIKTEIYKEVLRNEKKVKLDYVMVNNLNLREFEDRIVANMPEYSPFAKWLANAIFNDLYSTVKNRFFATLKFRLKSGEQLSSRELLVHQKKLEILYPWYQLIMNTEPAEFNLGIEAYLPSLLDAIGDYVGYYSIHTSWGAPPPSEELPPPPISLTWKEQPKSDENKEVEIVDEALKEIREESDEKIAGWKPDEEEMSELILPENYPTPDPNYEAPKELPQPIDDWVFDF